MLKKILIQKLLELFLELVANGYIRFPEYNSAALNGIDFCQIDDERPVHAHEF